MSDLEHWVWRLDPCFTLLAKIIILSDSTFVSNTDDRISIASVTDELVVDNVGLISFLFLKMLNQEFLILRSADLRHFVAQDLLQILEELVVKSSSTVALLAREPFFVNHFPIALKANWKVFNVIDWFVSSVQVIVLWFDDQALDVLLLSNVVLLLTLGFNHYFGAAFGIS
jgi:hypothetical protein